MLFYKDAIQIDILFIHKFYLWNLFRTSITTLFNSIITRDGGSSNERIFCFYFTKLYFIGTNQKTRLRKHEQKLLCVHFFHLLKFVVFQNSQEKQKDSLKKQAVLLIFSVEIKISEVDLQEMHPNKWKWLLPVKIFIV